MFKLFWINILGPFHALLVEDSIIRLDKTTLFVLRAQAAFCTSLVIPANKLRGEAYAS